MARSLRAGTRVALDNVGLFADGVAVREVGAHSFAIASQTVDDIVLVDSDAICAAIKDVFDDTRTIMEPAGALSVAGLKAWVAAQPERPGGSLVAVLSGANMNFDRLRFVAERAELGEQREALFAVTIPERKGAFREFCTILGPRVITEFNYRLSTRAEAHIFVGVATRSRADADDVLARLKAKAAKPDALVMHPGPMNRGVEIASEIADGPQSVIQEQVEMGVAVRMAVMEALLDPRRNDGGAQ